MDFVPFALGWLGWIGKNNFFLNEPLHLLRDFAPSCKHLLSL
jgi:hypothetical protein